jgi:hypothetical protein
MHTEEIDTQVKLDPYVVASYCTSYLTNVNKNFMQELHTMLEKCKVEKTKAFQHIQ